MVSSIFSLPTSAACLAYLSFIATPAFAASQTYLLNASYSGANFFDGWNFITGADPTHGFVNYRTSTDAASAGLISASAGQPAYMGVDYISTLNPAGTGRSSVRISSKLSWTHGLFIADIAHMPASVCGSWPAFWSFGPNWPNSGEIDVIEGVSMNTENLMSLHTGPNCVMNSGTMSGTANSYQCDGTQNGYAGCGIHSNNQATFGTNFNNNGGGVYAMEWTSDHITMWFFPKGSVPSDLTSGVPVPGNWGTPQAIFNGGSSCNIDTHFANHNLIFDTTFCGDWAGNVWSSDSTCSALASSCANYVAGNPSAFKGSYWSINSVKVYQLGNTPSKFASYYQQNFNAQEGNYFNTHVTLEMKTKFFSASIVTPTADIIVISVKLPSAPELGIQVSISSSWTFTAATEKEISRKSSIPFYQRV